MTYKESYYAITLELMLAQVADLKGRLPKDVLIYCGYTGIEGKMISLSVH